MLNPKWVKQYDLVRLSTYAKQIDKSLSWVIKLAKEGKITEVIIDGVHFIKTYGNGYKKV
jgi:allantoicase